MVDYGERALHFPCRELASVSTQAEQNEHIKIVLINGLNSNTLESPWISNGGYFWPSKWLCRDFRRAELLLVGNRMRSPPVRWQLFKQDADDLLLYMQRFQGTSRTGLIILCHGLGGLLFLQAMRGASESLQGMISAVFFFGTPLNGKKFNHAVRGCVSEELQVKKRTDDVDNDTIRNLEEVSHTIGGFGFNVKYFLEEKQLLPWLKMSRFVTRGASSQDCTSSYVILDQDHFNISKLDASCYKQHIKSYLEYVIRDRSNQLPVVANTLPAVDIDPLSRMAAATSASSSIAGLMGNQNTELNFTSIPLTAAPPADSSTVSPLVNINVRPDSTPREQQGISRDILERRHPVIDGSVLLPSVAPSLSPLIDTGGAISHTRSNPSKPSSTDLRSVLNFRPAQSSTLNVKLPCHQLPINDRDGTVKFVGREGYLNKISSELRPGAKRTREQGVTPAFAIIGFAGQGKTSTALEFAARNRGFYKSILWLHADTDQKMLNDISEHAIMLGLLASPSKDLWADAKALQNWYESTNEPWLLIFDNAIDPTLTRKFWPKNSYGSILVTSQDLQFKTPIGAGTGQELQSLEEGEALLMIKYGLPDITRTAAEETDAKAILKLIGYHPYFILIVITQILQAGCSLNDYYTSYDLKTIFAEAPGSYGNNLFKGYDRKAEQLWAQVISKLDPASRSLLEVCSLVDVDNFQENLLKANEKNEEIKEFEFVRNRVKCLKHLQTPWGLIYPNEIEGLQKTRSFHMHRLTQATIQGEMSLTARQAAFNSASLLLCAMISLPWELDWDKIRQQHRDFIPHIESLHTYYVENEGIDVPVNFVKLLWKAGWLCYKKNSLTLGQNFCKTGERILTNPTNNVRLIGDDREVAFVFVELHHTYASITTESPDFNTSYENYTAALKMFNARKHITTFPKNREYILYGGLANSLHGLERYSESEKQYRKCLELVPPDKKYPVYQVNICRCLWSLGRYAEASQGLEDFLSRRAAEFGPNDKRDYLSGHASYILGNVRISQNRLDDAYLLHLAAATNWKDTFGEHHKLADVYHKLGWHLERLKSYEDAIMSLCNALSIYESGTDKYLRAGEIARTKFKLGMVYKAKGLDRDGEECLTKAHQMRKEILGEKYFDAIGEHSFDELVSVWAR